jgi:hypothetical protein
MKPAVAIEDDGRGEDVSYLGGTLWSTELRDGVDSLLKGGTAGGRFGRALD